MYPKKSDTLKEQNIERYTYHRFMTTTNKHFPSNVSMTYLSLGMRERIEITAHEYTTKIVAVILCFLSTRNHYS